MTEQYDKLNMGLNMRGEARALCGALSPGGVPCGRLRGHGGYHAAQWEFNDMETWPVSPSDESDQNSPSPAGPAESGD